MAQTTRVTRTTPPALPRLTAPAAGGGTRGALAFEWTKLWSVRATWYALGVALLLEVGLAVVFGLSAEATGGNPARQAAPHLAADGITGAQLPVIVPAALAVTGEYATGAIAATLRSVPSRLRMQACKTLVVAAVTAVTGFVLSLLGTLAADLVMTQGAYTAGEALGTAAVCGVYLTLLAVLAVGVGFLLRSTAGAVTALFMILFVVPELMDLTALEWMEKAGNHTPGDAGTVLRTDYPSEPYGAATAVLVLAVWAAVAWAGGHAALRRRDA